MDFLLTFAVEKCELFLSENIANMTKIKKTRQTLKGRQVTDSVFSMRLFITEASEGHKVRDWNVSSHRLSPVLATEAQRSGLFSMGAATTVGLS